ncbi:hypothetical protein CHS0354_026825 [Potamilus streckersoni]|uniref:Flagellar basal-body rod protein FlgG n=1 Tax=Potamilus streckersoni TaxID=2493646 RepID=A0AAE0T628_9BIVA|nr:hypothetical protein CHS0354_026825 [Potamilus streckersoni]
MSGIYSLTSGAKVQQRIVESTATNLANANTVGFKPDRPVFKKHLDQAIGSDLESTEELYNTQHYLSPYNLGSTSYSVLDDTLVTHTQGPMSLTENPLDFAIQGEGFFTVDTPQGVRYTRDGQFSRDGEGYLVNGSGHYVMGENGRINVEGKFVNVLEDGTVEVDNVFKDKMRVVRFEEAGKLLKFGKNYFVGRDKTQTPIEMEKPLLKQGTVEQSPVETVEEMTALIGANRIYEATQRGIKVLDDIDQKSNTLARTMMRALYVGVTGMKAMDRQLQTVSHNIANVNTMGYKKERNNFQDLLYYNDKLPGSSTSVTTQMPTGLRTGSGVRHTSTEKLITQGNKSFTGMDLDIMIDGDGFFRVVRPDGVIAYTRESAFKRDLQGRLVTGDGYPLEPQIFIPQNAIKVNVSERGGVEVFFEGVPNPLPIGTIQLAQFNNEKGLMPVGKNQFLETRASGAPVAGLPGENGSGVLVQGFVELSNVDLVEEMVNMITSQRAYEANSKSITTSDNMLGTAVNLVRT